MLLLPDAADLRPATTLLKALADDTRLRIVALLGGGELCVCHIAAGLDISQPNASQHLLVLRNAGVVDSRRQGSWIYYRMNTTQDPARARILGAVLDSFQQLGLDDRKRLAATRASNTCD